MGPWPNPAGGLFSYDRLSIGAIDYYSEDVINVGYTEAKYVTCEFAGVGVLAAAQYIDQRSVGADLLEGFAWPLRPRLGAGVAVDDGVDAQRERGGRRRAVAASARSLLPCAAGGVGPTSYSR